MTLTEFNLLCGNDSYVLCKGKIRIDKNIVDAATAQKHLDKGGDNSIGWWIPTGYVVIDIDEGKKQLIEIIKILLPGTLAMPTPRGRHLVFLAEKFPQSTNMTLPCGLKCDTRTENKGYVILPFGQEKRKFNNLKKIKPLPLEWTPLQSKESLLNLEEGDGRNNSLFKHLMAYKRAGASKENIQLMAEVINSIVFAAPMPDKELESIVNSTQNYDTEKKKNPYLFYNDKGKANRVNYNKIANHFIDGQSIFILGGEAYVYKNGLYVRSDKEIKHEIKQMIAEDYLINHANIQNCMSLILDGLHVQRTAEDLNTDSNLINFIDGVWDISQKKLIPHSPEYLHTIQIPHHIGDFYSIEETPLGEFLDLCNFSQDDTRMLLEFIAYSMTFDYGLKAFLLLHGISNTGKSTLINFITRLVGEKNSAALSIADLNQKFYSAQLHHKLLNCCADNPATALKNIDALKKMTGGDKIMYELKGNPNIYYFTSFAKLIFSFNQLPLQLEEKSDAYYERMRIISMYKKLNLNKKYIDRLLSKESIQKTIPYLLSLLPLKEIRSTIKSTKAVITLRNDSDTIHAFLDTKCTLGPKKYILKEDLFKYYKEFCAEQGRESHKAHSFYRYLKSIGGFKEAREADTRNYIIKGVDIIYERDHIC